MSGSIIRGITISMGITDRPSKWFRSADCVTMYIPFLYIPLYTISLSEPFSRYGRYRNDL